MRKFFSVAIPTWEINGKGVEYLDYSLNIIAQQTFTDFEVVISDHSQNEDIKNLCEQWSQVIDIKYYKNEIGRGSIAPNLNNAIRNSSGKYIKTLFQDDFLYGTESLMKIYDYLKDREDVNWLVTSCAHTDDGEILYDQLYPIYNDKIYSGYNTISCPTVLTIKNENPLLVDESYNWLVDCVYYKNLYDKFGLPHIVNDLCAINRNAEVRTTNMITEQKKQDEVKRSIEFFERQVDLSRVTLIAVSSVDIENHVKALQYSCKNVKFGAVKLVCHEKPKNLPEEISYHSIERMNNIDDWNHSIIYKLGDYIDTEFALLIHSDGFVINPNSWREEFFNYDYIGAPWPIPNDNFSYRDINGDLIRVGNSVSLRSKKLIDLAKELNLEWKSFHGYYSEDGFICVNNRHIYKDHGCKFADIDVARYFSHETELPETKGIAPFVFHGKNKYIL
jgi:hypothetical protein